METHDLDVPALIKELDEACALVANADLSAGLKNDLKSKALVYASFLTDLNDGRLAPEHDGVVQMLASVREFSPMVRNALTAR